MPVPLFWDLWASGWGALVVVLQLVLQPTKRPLQTRLAT